MKNIKNMKYLKDNYVAIMMDGDFSIHSTKTGREYSVGRCEDFAGRTFDIGVIYDVTDNDDEPIFKFVEFYFGVDFVYDGESQFRGFCDACFYAITKYEEELNK